MSALTDILTAHAYTATPSGTDPRLLRCLCGEYVPSWAAHVVEVISKTPGIAVVELPKPEEELVAAVQDAVVAAINTLGVTLVGSGFTPVTSSPIPDAEVAKIVAAVVAGQPTEPGEE